MCGFCFCSLLCPSPLYNRLYTTISSDTSGDTAVPSTTEPISPTSASCPSFSASDGDSEYDSASKPFDPFEHLCSARRAYPDLSMIEVVWGLSAKLEECFPDEAVLFNEYVDAHKESIYSDKELQFVQACSVLSDAQRDDEELLELLYSQFVGSAARSPSTSLWNTPKELLSRKQKKALRKKKQHKYGLAAAEHAKMQSKSHRTVPSNTRSPILTRSRADRVS